jgi:putative endonuclease
MSSSKQSLGRWGEARAAEFLEAQGYQIVERNWRCEYGEIDLIARKDSVLVFIEVKARTSQRFGYPEEAVTPTKQQHLIEATQTYLQTLTEQEDGDWRIDVIAVERAADGPQIHHIENAIG